MAEVTASPFSDQRNLFSMTEKLKRITSEADMHKVLDIAYLAAMMIGLWQFSAAIAAIALGDSYTSTVLFAIQMALLSLCGTLAYFWHIKGEVYKEAAMIAPIVAGYLTAMAGHAAYGFDLIADDRFVVDMQGIAVALGLVLIVEMLLRLYKIIQRRRQIKLSQATRAEAEKPINPAYLEEKTRHATTL